MQTSDAEFRVKHAEVALRDVEGLQIDVRDAWPVIHGPQSPASATLRKAVIAALDLDAIKTHARDQLTRDLATARETLLKTLKERIKELENG